ncbi:unnamed protein product [Dicrocoelium dendriticum]|nr:unnamed protein product [Dicrocoelium dendriticum]
MVGLPSPGPRRRTLNEGSKTKPQTLFLLSYCVFLFQPSNVHAQYDLDDPFRCQRICTPDKCRCVGLKGVEGPPGPIGQTGEWGIAGDRGVPGLPGTKGDKGSSGLLGRQGFKGEQGVQGPPGYHGQNGLSVSIFT